MGRRKARHEFDSRQLYLRLLTYVRPHWRVFAIAIGCMGLSSLAEPALPALMKYVLDDGFVRNQGSGDWLFYPLAIFSIFVVRALIGFVADYAMNWISQTVILDLRDAMFANMLRLSSQYYTDNSSGRILSRISNDVAGVTAAATTAITTVVKDSLAVIGLLAWLFYLNWKLTLITVAMVPLIGMTVRAFSNRVRHLARKSQDANGSLIQVLQESIEGHKVVKIFGGQDYEAGRFRDVSRDIRGLSLRYSIASSAQGPIVQFFAAAALAIIMGIALRQASNGEGSVGDFVSFITAMLMTLAPTKRLTDINAAIQKGLVAAESVFHLVDLPAEPDTGTVTLARAGGAVEFDAVTFAYPGSQRHALDQLSFRIAPGECVALVGPSGSGKTTVANLLPRLYGLTEGAIRIDGHRLEELALASLRQHIALVSQEVVLFNDTVAANIAYGGKRDATRAEIVSAARAANAMEFIELLPAGLDTLIGEKGVKLSGGQRQRIAIARALLKDAPILILDEATSALDTESERLVQAALDQLMKGRTTLVIAHRLSTVERADRIVVLAHGRKIEEGSHSELLALDGLYARLYQRQRDEATEVVG